MVVICSECCASNNDNAVFCSTCGIQLVSQPTPLQLVQGYEDLHRNVGDLSQRNVTLDDRIRKTTEEVKALTEQLKAEEQAHKTDVGKELSQRRVLEDRLQRTMAEVRNLTAQVRETEQVHRREIVRVTELTEANNRLLQEVRRLTRKPRYCDRCGGSLVATANPNVDLCPVCDAYWYVLAQSYASPTVQMRQEEAAVAPGEDEEDYAHPGSMHAGRSWHGIFIHENCGFCGQQLQLTTRSDILYCQYCGRYQEHIHK